MYTTSIGAWNEEIARSHTTIRNKNDRDAAASNYYSIFADTNTINTRISGVNEQTIIGEIVGTFKVSVKGNKCTYY